MDELKETRSERNDAGFFEFDLKSRLDRKITDLSARKRNLVDEGRCLDEEAKNELMSLCSKYGISFYDRFCKGDDGWGFPQWESFDEWCRKRKIW